jgi:hypothetical protein
MPLYDVTINALNGQDEATFIGRKKVLADSQSAAQTIVLQDVWDDQLNSASFRPGYDTAQIPRYVHRGWSHIFSNSNTDQDLRLVFDRATDRIVAMELIKSRGTETAGSMAIADVQDSLLNANAEALDHPEDWGLEESDQLPDWATPAVASYLSQANGLAAKPPGSFSPRTDMHVYAMVRVKVLATSAAGASSKEIAEEISDAVCADSNQWMRPVHGVVKSRNGIFDIEAMEFAEGISSVLVDEYAPEGKRPLKEIRSGVFNCGVDLQSLSRLPASGRTQVRALD